MFYHNKMTAMEIKQLIDRYMNGQTTVDEEQILARYFRSATDLPDDLQPYRDIRLLRRGYASR